MHTAIRPLGLSRSRSRLLAKATEETYQVFGKLADLSDAELADGFRSLTPSLTDPERATAGALAQAAAHVVEALRRTLGVTLYPTQVLGGLAVLTGGVSEMQTGEGKTYTVLIPACVHALAGCGVHVATANPYLAERDAALLRPAYQVLGFDVGVADHSSPVTERRAAYACSVTYATAATLGFDYLSDNLALDTDDVVQRGFHACIVDEADSLLVDEARTPLVISGRGRHHGSWEEAARVAAALDREADLIVDEAEQWAVLSEQGAAHAASLLGVTSVFEDHVTLSRVLACVRAGALFASGRDYVVQDDRVLLIDEHTGRLLADRRLRGGLHEAIEALEGVPVSVPQRIVAQTTLQSFFGMYRFLGGMTGTAADLADELWETYGLTVAVIPTHRPCRRVDHPDRFYANDEERLTVLVTDVRTRSQAGQPVLIGTASVAESDRVAAALNSAGVSCAVLNARDDVREAEIIADAGRPGAVTVSTNMAGRGVDILLGGDPTHHPAGQVAADRERVLAAGGLCVIGTSRYPSRRVDRQLRGRAGRQGDPGESVFLLSATDDLVRVFAPAALSGVLTAHSGGGEVPMIGRYVERAQRRVEEQQRLARRQMLEFDGVDTVQRNAFYDFRAQLLEADLDGLCDLLAGPASRLVFATPSGPYTVRQLMPPEKRFASEPTSPEALEALFRTALEERLAPLATGMDGEVLTRTRIEVVRRLVLQLLDEFWSEHLTHMDALKENAPLSAYAQVGPASAYTDEALTALTATLQRYVQAALVLLYKVKLDVTPAAEPQPEPADDPMR